MTTSGTYNFSPSLADIVAYAYNIAGVRSTSLTQEHITTARLASNMVCVNFSNRGVNLWEVDLVQTPLVQGQATYTVDPSTVIILDAYVTIDNGIAQPTDRIIMPISRSEYAAYPQKEQQGFPTVFWFDRLTNPNVTLWPVPDGSSAQYLKYYRMTQLQDAVLTNGKTPDVPYLWLEAFTDQLAYRLATIWNPQVAPALKAVADGSWQTAADQGVEQANFYVSPQVSDYYRP